jgi:hypothetical protein
MGRKPNMLARYLYPILVALAALSLGVIAKGVYYQIKPLLPRRFRLWLRRILAARQRDQNRHTWPIYKPAGQTPADWPGWPAGHSFALVLTHDVESQLGLDRVKQVAELEMSLGFRSSFNFIPEGPYQVPDELRQWLATHGFEVGVHDHRHDGKLFQSLDRFRSSAQRINHYLRAWNAVGFRAGFMLRNLEWIHELDVRYDSSTFDTDPFEPQPEGMHTIFPFWVGKNEGGYVELPYTLVQDSTLFLLLQETSIAIWKEKLSWIASRGGMALLNVHPDYLAFDRDQATWGEYPAARYREFLEWVKQAHADRFWAALPREVAAHYLDGICHTAKREAPASLTPVGRGALRATSELGLAEARRDGSTRPV